MSVGIGTETSSEWKAIFRGCPQGSNFGPLLWNVFQNDLVYNAVKSNIKVRADDHQIYVSGETMGDVETGL